MLHSMLQWFDFMNLDLTTKNMNDCMPRKCMYGDSNEKWGSKYHNLIMSKNFWQTKICSQSFNCKLNVERSYEKRFDHNWLRRMGFPLLNCDALHKNKFKVSCCKYLWWTCRNDNQLYFEMKHHLKNDPFLYAWKHSISYSFETIENVIESCWGCSPF